MAVRVSPTASFSSGSLVLPDLRGFRYANFFGTDDATALRNMIDPAAPATKSGTLVHGPDYVETSSNGAGTPGSIVTPYVAAPGEDFFAVLVSRRATAGAQFLATGVNANAQTVSLGIYNNATGPLVRNSQASAAGAAQGVWPGSSTTDYYITMAWGRARGLPAVQGALAGVLQGVYLPTGLPGGGYPKRAIGAQIELNPDAAGNVSIRYHFAAFGNRIPDESERAEIAARLFTRANARGNVVVA